MSTIRAFSLALLLVAGAEAAAEEAILAGAGALSCGEMLRDVSETANMKSTYASWMQGFMSALNYLNAAKKSVHIDLNYDEGQWVWLKNWCNEHPLELVAYGVDDLYVELIEQQGLTEVMRPAQSHRK